MVLLIDSPICSNKRHDKGDMSVNDLIIVQINFERFIEDFWKESLVSVLCNRSKALTLRFPKEESL